MTRLLSAIIAMVAPIIPVIVACNTESPSQGTASPAPTFEGCDPNAEPTRGDLSECDCDNQCPEGTLCGFTFFGNTCGGGTLCATDESCAPEDECRLRDDCGAFGGCRRSGSASMATRKTCEPRRCSCDADCPEGYLCGSSAAASGEVCVVGDFCDSDAYCGLSHQCVTETRPACSAPRTGCRPSPCMSDNDCPAGWICAAPVGVNECVQ